MINNVDVAMVSTPNEIRSALARQACSPVLWVESIRRIADAGVTHIFECGPGRILAGLTRRIAPQVESGALTDDAALLKAREAVRR